MSLIKKALYVVIMGIISIFVLTNVVKAQSLEVTTETLNLRKEASTDSDILALMSIGDECELLEEEGEWYKVKYEDYTGYISKEYAKKVGSSSNSENDSNSKNETNSSNEKEDEELVKEENSDTATTSETASSEGKINKDADIRIVPLINGGILENLKASTQVTIINTVNGWSYVQTDEISGWIRSNYIDANNTDKTTETNSDEDNNSEVSDSSKENSDNKQEENGSSSNFTEKTMYAKDYINIRKQPNTNSDIVMVVSPNTELKVIDEEGDWYKVSTSQGDAYVSKELLSSSKVEITNRGDIDRTKESTKEAEDDKSSTSIASNENTTSTDSSSSSVTGTEIVNYAKKFLGVPYVYGGASSSGFDCSGFTMYVYNHFGISMAHGAQSQSKIGTAINTDKSSKTSILNNLKAGDLVFFLDYETMDEIGHCGIYIGNGNFIHASSGSGYCVKISSLLPGESYNNRYCAARRVL